MKSLIKILSGTFVCATVLSASGYRIPEQSSNAVALSAANIAANKSADASYYNPANMSWMESSNHIEANINYIRLPQVNFENSSSMPGTSNGKSKTESFFVPTIFYVSPQYKNSLRFGFSITAPGGLSKRWETAYMKASAKEFTLKIIELNPSLSYKINDKLSLGLGLRAIYSDGIVKSDASGLGRNVSRNMNGDSIDYGYNLALAYRPTDDLKLATTYRSKVDLTIEGDANININRPVYSSSATVTIPLPAVFDLAIAYTFDKTTLEFVYEREYWSSYKNLDFNYKTTLPVFDEPIDKNWKDANVYRVGITHEYSDELTLLGGFAYNESPVPNNTYGFELPDSESYIYSGGFNYKINKNLNFGMSYLYCDKKDKKINRLDNRSPISTIQGEFKNNAAHILSTSLQYKF